MNEMFAVLLSVWIAFAIGFAVPMFIGRGLFGLYLKAFFSGKVLLRVHLKKGGAVFRLGGPVPGGSMVAWAMNGKKDMRFTSLHEAAIVRVARIRWMDIDENYTAPFRFDMVEPVMQKFEIPIPEDQQEKGKDGEPVTTKEILQKVGYKLFEGWNDNAIVRQVYHWALMRPRRKLPGLGIDLKTVLIILAVIAGIIFFVIQIQAQGQGNVIG